MKADLAIYSYVLDIFKSVGFIISNKMDFIFCADKDGFRKSSHTHIYIIIYIYIYIYIIIYI